MRTLDRSVPSAFPASHVRPFPRVVTESLPSPGPFNPPAPRRNGPGEGWSALWTTVMAMAPMFGTLVVVLIVLIGA